MNRIKTSLCLLLLSLAQVCLAQSGPWAKYDQQLKDDALYREASAGNLEEVKSIVAGGGNIHAKASMTNSTVLMSAAGSGKIEVVRYLLGLGADPAAKDWWSMTALDKARSVGAKDIEQLLLDAMRGTRAEPEEKIKEPEKPESKAEKEGTPTTPTASPAPKPMPGTVPGANAWPVFGSYRVGEPVLYWVPSGWRKGVIREIGVLHKSGKVSVDYSERKYLIDPDATALSEEWHEWTGVVRPTREPFWTSWFVGAWEIGEVAAHHNEVRNGTEKDTYYYMSATETLRVNADRTYRWKPVNGKVITGKWVPAKDQPGILLLKAYRGFDWALTNRTSVDDWGIRKLDMIDLTPSAPVGGIKGKRKTTL